MLIDLLRLSRPRTWLFTLIAFFIGWSLTGSDFTFTFMIGLVAYWLLVANVNILNSYTDIEEDRLNLPKRIILVKKIGHEKLPFVVFSIYLISLFISYFVSFWFFVIFLIAVFDNAFYSLKPLRFKANPLMSLLSFSGAVFFPLFGAWAIVNDVFNAPLLIFFISYSFLVYGTVKNIPDYEGDKKSRLKTTATIFKSKLDAIKFSAILLISPYLILLILIISNLLEYKFFLLFLCLPIILMICLKTIRAERFEKLEKLHTYGFLYQITFLSIAFLLASPTISSALVIVFNLSFLFVVVRTKFDSR